jgi:hypothetical protein
MERQFGWIRAAAAAAIVAGTTGPQADAQFAPYRLAQQQSASAAAATTPAAPPASMPPATQPAYAPYRPQAQQPAAQAQAQPIARVAAAPQYPRVAANYPQVAATYPQSSATYPTAAAYPQASPAYPQTTATYPQATYPQATYPQTSGAYPQPAAQAYPQTVAQYPPYTAYPQVARQPGDLPAPNGDNGTLPMPNRNGEPMNGEANGYNGLQNGEATSGEYSSGEHTNGATNGAANGHSLPSENGTRMHVENGHNGYPTTGYSQGEAVGADCNGQAGYADYGLSGYFDNPHHDSNWFGGVYYLFMTRDDAEYRRLTAMFDTPAGGYPYYPVSDFTVLHTNSVDHDYRSGAEVRFGSTFATGTRDECNSGCGTAYGYGYGGSDSGCSDSCDMQEYAWEVGYWILDDDSNVAEAIDSDANDTNRMYGMKNFAGLEYNGRDVNDWYDYQVPVTDPGAVGATDIRLLAQRVRSNFRAQNLELNFLRLPMFGGATCGSGSAAGDCGESECEPACGNPFTMTTLCGVRYLRVDDDFEYGTMWAVDAGGVLTPPAYTPWDGVGELYYDINVDNQLVGFQLGANMNYVVSCKCNVFWNSSFGLYNNHIDVYQRVYGALGPATWTQSGEDAVIRAKKDDVAFAGEMLIGGSYDFGHQWRGILAYRAVAVSGIALSVDQMPENFANEAEVALVDSNGSLVIHGVQIGAECRY